MADSDINIRKLYTLKIWEDYRRLVQPSGTDGLARMEEQIHRFGCGEPVYVWSRRLLVDFERYATFHRLGIPFRIKNCSARNGEEVIDWICRNQLQRTDLSDAMRRYLIGRQYLSLKLLGAHYAASGSFHTGNRRNSSAGTSKYEPVPIRIREMLGKLYHIRQETVERYATYAKAIDIVRAAVPELAEGLLFGRLWLTVDRIMELPYKTPEELQKLNVLLRSGIDPPGGGSCLDTILPAGIRKPALSDVPKISVKDMPSYDPDAEIASLTLTIPAWISSIRRANQSVNFSAISSGARQAARKELILLKHEVEAVLHTIKKEG